MNIEMKQVHSCLKCMVYTFVAVVHLCVRPIDLDEQIHCRINQSIAIDCKAFRPRRASSTEYKTVLYSVDKGIRGRNVLQSVAIDSATYSLIKIYSPVACSNEPL